MEDQTEERWYQLCQLAQIEQDPEKLMALVTEINRLLDPTRKPSRSETQETEVRELLR